MRSILTVVTAADTYDLTTLDTLKEDLGITNNDNDNYLHRLIHEASGMIADYTGRVWALETLSETFPIDWYNRTGSVPPEGGVVLSRFPVVGDVAITQDDATVLVEGTDFQVDRERGLLTRLWSGQTGWYWFNTTVTVVYSAGYDLLDSLPYPIEMACLTLCRGRWTSRGRDPMLRVVDIPGVRRQEFWVGGGAGTSTNGAIPPEVAGLLDRYVARNV